MRIVPTKEWVQKLLVSHEKEDMANDRQLFLDLINAHMAPINLELGELRGEIAHLHQENLKKLDSIHDLLENLSRGGRHRL